MTLSVWLLAARPRTLILALAGIAMGILLAAVDTTVDWIIAALTLATALLLQILSNLANDYGDSVHGADRADRAGPSRAVQSGRISPRAMRRAVVVTAILAAATGALLVYLALGPAGALIAGLFLLVGLAAIWAAISYTAGGLPYGYVGLGDLFVLLFFGYAAVLGSYFLQVGRLDPALLLPATSCGLFAVAVLNINNVRDMTSDREAGKYSIPVRLGLARARAYHWLLLLGGFGAGLVYVALRYTSAWQLLFLVSLPLLLQNGLAVSRRPPERLDPYLRQMSLASLVFVLTFGMGQLLA